MKKFFVYLSILSLIILAIGCQKHEYVIGENGEVYNPSDPQVGMIEGVFLSSVSNTGQTSTTSSAPVYEYVLAIANNRYTGDGLITMGNTSVARVHNGVTTYQNQADAPYFRVSQITGTHTYVTVRCEVKDTPEPLKFNISVDGYWFLAIHLKSDDSQTNMNMVRFKKDGIDIIDPRDNRVIKTL
jgi:hypothetical protein